MAESVTFISVRCECWFVFPRNAAATAERRPRRYQLRQQRTIAFTWPGLAMNVVSFMISPSNEYRFVTGLCSGPPRLFERFRGLRRGKQYRLLLYQIFKSTDLKIISFPITKKPMRELGPTLGSPVDGT